MHITVLFYPDCENDLSSNGNLTCDHYNILGSIQSCCLVVHYMSVTHFTSICEHDFVLLPLTNVTVVQKFSMTAFNVDTILMLMLQNIYGHVSVKN
jgi:hypothetical protein